MYKTKSYDTHPITIGQPIEWQSNIKTSCDCKTATVCLLGETAVSYMLTLFKGPTFRNGDHSKRPGI